MSIDVLVNDEGNLSLRGMVDIALGTPEVGSVNFNMLHTLLHALISKFDLESVVIALSPEDIQMKKNKTPANVISLSTTPFHLLQDRIKTIEKQFSDLNSLPSNKEILNGIFGVDKTAIADSKDKRLVSELWQTLNMRKKINANEEGIDKLSSLIDSILREMKELRSDNDNMRKKLEGLENLSGINDKINELQNDFAKLLDEFKLLKEKISEYPNDEFFQNVVTWEGLEKALRGVRDEMDEFTKPKEKVFVNMLTEIITKPPSNIYTGPSQLCSDMLENLGSLTEAHALLDARVVILEEEMPNKADKKDLEKFNCCDDLLMMINQLKSQVETLLTSKNKDAEALSKIRDLLNSLQKKIDDVNFSVEKLTKDNKDLLKQIEELFQVTNDHESRKADIGYVDGQLLTKADKSLVDSKVSFNIFDETTGNLHNLINDVLRKLLAAEEELRNLLKAMAAELNGKVDREELNALKDWIEKRLKLLADKIKNLRGIDINEDEAAGLRKQLLQHFHCISCDRPVDMIPQGLPYASGLPDPKGLPPTKSMRPYTSYEMESIRLQQAKGNKNIYVQNHTKRYGADIVDVYQTPRPCGGSHTTTYSHKKMIRSGNLNNSNFEDEISTKELRDELDLQGVDGHIYKGRIDRTQPLISNTNVYSDQSNFDKLPPVPINQRSQTVMGSNTLYQNSVINPHGAIVVNRPKSAVKLTPRPASNGFDSRSRPESARQHSKEPDSRPTTPVRNDFQHFNNIEQDITDVDHNTVIESENFESDMVKLENSQLNDENALSL